MRSLEQELAGVALFAGIDGDELSLVAGCGRHAHFGDGEYLFRTGGAADTFYVVRQGTVAIEAFVPTRGSVSIETVGAGEVVGWSWLFPPYRWHFDARAVDGVRATAFDGACLREKSAADPALGYDLMSRFAQVLIERMQATRIRLLDVYGDDGR